MSISNLGLDALLAVAETGTVLKAAENLGVTQTAVTQRIKSLELEVGAALFVRSRRGMSLTSQGKVLLAYAREQRGQQTRVLSQIMGSAIDVPFRLRISGPTIQSHRRILPQLKVLKEEYPALYFDLQMDDSGNLLERLRNQEVDIVLHPAAKDKGLPTKRLGPTEFALLGPYGWRKRELKDILRNESIVDFNDRDTYTLEFLKQQRLLPAQLRERHFVNNTFQMIDFVVQGLGFAVFDIHYVGRLLREKKLCNLAPDHVKKIEWALFWSNSGEHTHPALARLIELIE